MISIRTSGSFRNSIKFLHHALRVDYMSILEHYGQKGVDALAAATPKDTGKTAESWVYQIEQTGSGWAIVWSNTNVYRGINIAIILQYGHGTGTGGYVQGRDYINPAIQPIFDEMAEKIWKELESK